MISRAKPEKIVEYAEVMERAVDDIGEIITGFLQFSRPTTGDFEKAGINSLVKSIEMMISANAYKHGIKAYFYYTSTEEPVLINSHQIKNAILGIVDNAIYAMSGAIDPKLIISTEYDSNNCLMKVSIKDNGIGMTEEQLENVGTPFYTTKPRGTGLGVSVIKYIVNEHGGTFKIESKFGEGAVFSIALPCTAPK
jgi:signal transduction histidine kinase